MDAQLLTLLIITVVLLTFAFTLRSLVLGRVRAIQVRINFLEEINKKLK